MLRRLKQLIIPLLINTQQRKQYNNGHDLTQVKEKEISHLFDKYLSNIYRVSGTRNKETKKQRKIRSLPS